MENSMPAKRRNKGTSQRVPATENRAGARLNRPPEAMQPTREITRQRLPQRPPQTPRPPPRRVPMSAMIGGAVALVIIIAAAAYFLYFNKPAASTDLNPTTFTGTKVAEEGQ